MLLLMPNWDTLYMYIRAVAVKKHNLVLPFLRFKQAYFRLLLTASYGNMAQPFVCTDIHIA